VRTKSWLGQGFPTQSSPNVASALTLTIRMHNVDFVRPARFSPKCGHGLGSRPAGWAGRRQCGHRHDSSHVLSSSGVRRCLTIENGPTDAPSFAPVWSWPCGSPTWQRPGRRAGAQYGCRCVGPRRHGAGELSAHDAGCHRWTTHIRHPLQPAGRGLTAGPTACRISLPAKAFCRWHETYPQRLATTAGSCRSRRAEARPGRRR
jgi:hypothetical protein